MGRHAIGKKHTEPIPTISFRKIKLQGFISFKITD